MNKETALAFQILLQALIEGKTIQVRHYNHNSMWRDMHPDEGFDDHDPNNYRIKEDVVKAEGFRLFVYKNLDTGKHHVGLCCEACSNPSVVEKYKDFVYWTDFEWRYVEVHDKTLSQKRIDTPPPQTWQGLHVIPPKPEGPPNTWIGPHIAQPRNEP